jgi:exosortase family protein XrtF
MPKIYQENKPFFTFLFKFFGAFGLLSILYKIYLSLYIGIEIDFFTKLVAKQSIWIIDLLNFPVSGFPAEKEAAVNVYIQNKVIARIVEGCNAIAVINLFVAFVIAFKGRLKTTLWFILMGILGVHVLNILRIALITICYYKFPQHEKLFHDIIFPLIIYGFVFVLWIIWIKKYSDYAQNISK